MFDVGYEPDSDSIEKSSSVHLDLDQKSYVRRNDINDAEMSQDIESVKGSVTHTPRKRHPPRKHTSHDILPKQAADDIKQARAQDIHLKS